MPVVSYTGVSIPSFYDYAMEYKNQPPDLFASALTTEEKEIFIEFEKYDRYGEEYTQKYNIKIMSGATITYQFV